CKIISGDPPLTCSAQGRESAPTTPVKTPCELVITLPRKPEPSWHFAITWPLMIGAPTAAVPLSCALAGTALELLLDNEELTELLMRLLEELLLGTEEALLTLLALLPPPPPPQPLRTNRRATAKAVNNWVRIPIPLSE